MSKTSSDHLKQSCGMIRAGRDYVACSTYHFKLAGNTAMAECARLLAEEIAKLAQEVDELCKR